MKRLLLPALLLAAAPLPAQGLDFLWGLGFSAPGGAATPNQPDPLVRLHDVNGDNRIQYPGIEAVTLTGVTASLNDDNDTCLMLTPAVATLHTDSTWAMEDGLLVFYLHTGDDFDQNILRVCDTNHNGRLEDTEVTVYYDAQNDVASQPSGVPTAGDLYRMPEAMAAYYDPDEDGRVRLRGLVISTDGNSVAEAARVCEANPTAAAAAGRALAAEVLASGGSEILAALPSWEAPA